MSSGILEQLAKLDDLQTARSVALFWPMIERGEVDLRPLDQRLRGLGKAVYYPFMRRDAAGGKHYGFSLTHAVSDLVDVGKGFLEPREPQAAAAGELDLVLVPALAADQRGHRIGYGAGYYDQTLLQVRPPARAWIVAFEFQRVAYLEDEAHDHPCDGLVTECGTYPARD